MSDERKYEYIVLALDALIGDPEIINPGHDTPKIADNIVIPSTYLNEFYEIYYEQSTRGDSAVICMDILTDHIKNMGNASKCLLPNDSVFHIFDNEKDIELSSSDQVINVAKHLKNEEKSVAILTGSRRQAPIVWRNGIDVLDFERDIYTGRRKLNLPYEFSNEWYGNRKISAKTFAEMYPLEPSLKANEFIEFVSGPEQTTGGNFAHIGRFDIHNNAIVPLKYFKDLPYGIYPRNAGQAMLTEALMMPPDELPIVIVSGIHGTGKTFLTLAAGLCQTEGNGHRPIYDRVFVVPRDSYLGREHGYLKGDLLEKLLPTLGSLEDSLRKIIKLRGPKASKYRAKQEKNGTKDDSYAAKSIKSEIEWYFTESDFFDFDAIINMGGRSIDDSFIIYDEFQDMERRQAKALLTRIGEHSKNVIMGDPTQFTNPHLSKTSNGLAYVANNVYNKYDGAAVITMLPSECERSNPAKAIAAIFGNR